MNTIILLTLMLSDILFSFLVLIMLVILAKSSRNKKSSSKIYEDMNKIKKQINDEEEYVL